MARPLNITLWIRIAGAVLALFILFSLVRFTKSIVRSKPKATVESTVVLEKIDKVLKLITVEGNYSHIMTYKDYQGLDIWGLRKKAIITVKGKVLVGYDLEKLQVDVDEDNKVIRFVQLPEPEIMAVDADLSYYDLEEGVFNRFDEQDLTKLNKKAKEVVRNSAVKEKLTNEARLSLRENLDIITLTARAQGWTIKYPETTFKD